MDHADLTRLAQANRKTLEEADAGIERSPPDDPDDSLHAAALAIIEKALTKAREGAQAARPVRFTRGEASGLRVALAVTLGECMRLHKRVRELEARPALKYVGTWQRGRSYAPGDVCTHHGSAWHVNANTTGEPGKVAAFTLMVKRGRDR